MSTAVIQPQRPPDAAKVYSREELIEICEQAVVSERKWSNRDSAHSQIGIGTAWVLLKAGCEFEQLNHGHCKTDSETIWIEITYHGFQAFEWGDEERETDTFYIPTPKRLAERESGDWY